MSREEQMPQKDGEGGLKIDIEKVKLSTEVQACPRCNSMNTKFCYFNNYSLSQPRYYCKDCKRHWTKGGALRDIPIGGKPRTAKRSRRSSSSSTTTTTAATHQAQPQLPPPPFNQPMNQQVLPDGSVDIASLFVSQANAIPPTLSLNNSNALSMGGFGGYFGGTTGFQVMCNGSLAAYNNRLPPAMNGLTFQQPLPLQHQQQRAAASGPSSTAWSTIVHWNGQGAPGGANNNN